MPLPLPSSFGIFLRQFSSRRFIFCESLLFRPSSVSSLQIIVLNLLAWLFRGLSPHLSCFLFILCRLLLAVSLWAGRRVGPRTGSYYPMTGKIESHVWMTDQLLFILLIFPWFAHSCFLPVCFHESTWVGLLSVRIIFFLFPWHLLHWTLKLHFLLPSDDIMRGLGRTLLSPLWVCELI